MRNELKAKGLHDFFHVWVAEDWFSPDGCPGIAIPYYLFHPELIRLQKSFGLRAEGTNKSWALKLIRHEVGHAIENAWRLRRRKKRQQLFGLSTQPYPQFYRPIKSQNYVDHLGDDYAQSHPDEDWAETFAVWLSSSERSWRRKYPAGIAREKLEYCDQIMNEIRFTKPINTERFVVSPITDQRGTIASFMQKQAVSQVRTILKMPNAPKLSRELPSAAILKQAQIWSKRSGLGILM